MITFGKLQLLKEIIIRKSQCLLDYPYFKEYYEMVAINLIKQRVLNPDAKPLQKNNFAVNLDRAATMFILY